MSTPDIMCPHCGWRNPAWARICGGCGRPLRHATSPDAGATVATPTPSEAQPYPPLPADEPYLDPARTNASGPAYEPPPPIGPAAVPALSTAPVPWPDGAAPAGQRRAQGRSRVVVVALATLFILVLAALGVWAAFIRPAVHNQVDGQLRAALASTISQIPPSAPPNEYALSAATINANLNNQIPANSGIESAEVHFQNGDIVLDYNYQGSPGTVTTQLVSQNGRLVAQNTTVTGLLGWVESGDDVQAALNAEFAGIPSGYRITSLRTDNDTLFINVNG